ncbi:Phosphodiester glycosidase [uncultured archaeon]|nr:Phosphodiester glycosidase [uncultured archaeon]
MLEFQIERQAAAPDRTSVAASSETTILSRDVSAEYVRGKYALVIFPPAKMSVVADESGIDAEKFANANREKYAVVANGTYFRKEGDGSYKATGVLVLDGKKVYPYQENSWKGVFGITSEGTPFIMGNGAFCQKYAEENYGALRLAFAGGRMLVSEGKINERINDDPNKASERTVLGIKGDGSLFLYCTSEKRTQAEIAQDILGNVPGVKDAINLDGGSSSQLYAPSKPDMNVGNGNDVLGFFLSPFRGSNKVHSVICVGK